MNKYADDVQCFDFLDTAWEYSWDFAWLGWKRCLWLSFQVDFQYKAVAIVFFGLMVGYGRRLKKL